jgi:hypothetical protein
MMLYEIIKIEKGKETVMFRESKPKCHDRIKTLRNSRRKSNLRFEIRATLSNEKYSRPPIDGSWREGKSFSPKVVR